MAPNAFVKNLLKFLDEYYPEAQCSLDFKNPYELLVATILSAQCTDIRVNKTTPALFTQYPGPREMAAAELAAIEEIIRPCGFYHNKAKNIIAMSQSLMIQHQGEVPQTQEALVKLAGVGRKTANVVLGNVFNVPALTVDTHLGRLARRWKLSASQDPNKVEADLIAIIPQKIWTKFSHQSIAHGRALCLSQKPKCLDCPFAHHCPSRI